MNFQNPNTSGVVPNAMPSYTSVSGSRATSNVGSSAAKREVDEAMITFKPYQTPILNRLLQSKFGKKPSGNQKFEWVYSSLLPRVDTVTLAGGSTTESAATVGDYTLYQKGTIIVVDSTGDVLITTNNPSSNSVNFTKIGSGNITAASSATTHFLGDAFEQGASSAVAKSVNKNFEYNYCEIFKRSVQETQSQAATVEYGPIDWERNKMDRMEEIKLDLEQSLLRGIRSSFTGVQAGSYTQFTSGGFFDSSAAFIAANYVYSGGVIAEDYFFNTFIKGAYSRGSNSKTLYCGAALLNNIAEFSKVKQKTQVSDKEYGYQITTIVHNFGKLNLVWHPMLEGDVFGKQGVCIDDSTAQIVLRYLAGNGVNRDINFYDYTQPLYQETDSRKAEWKGEVGWQISGNEYHSLLTSAS